MPVLPTLFRLASRLRGARAFHPRGAVWDATWEPAATSPLPVGSPLRDGPRPALLRFSHGVGLGSRAPDILGWAVKVLAVHEAGTDQDLLLASTGEGRVTRHLLRTSTDLGRTLFSSLLPYQVAGVGRAVVVAVASPPAPLTYAEVIEGRHAPPDRFEVRLRDRRGPLLAAVTPHARHAARAGDALRYDPWHTGPELTPVGAINRLRRPTYRASQRGRGALPRRG